MFNFRADRVVEISKALEYKDFDKFDRKRFPDVRALPGACMPACQLLSGRKRFPDVRATRLSLHARM